jgi:hypothetical protein
MQFLELEQALLSFLKGGGEEITLERKNRITDSMTSYALLF